MKTTKRSSRKSTGASASKIKESYLEYLLRKGKQPASVYKFCLDQGIKEDDFYCCFSSFDGVDRHVWKEFMEETTNRLKENTSYQDFNSREKLLIFYFTLLQAMKARRSFVLLQLKNFRGYEVMPTFLSDFRKAFDAFINDLIAASKVNGEIASRPLMGKLYPQTFWIHCVFLIFFWKTDNSKDFEKTDAAVEKSVNLAFDLIGKGAFDTAMDFAKFLYQSRY